MSRVLSKPRGVASDAIMRRALWCLLVLAGVALLVFTSAPAGAASASIEEAYKREFAFLEAERHSLEQRISQLEKDHARQVAEARAALDALQGQVMTKALTADSLQEALLNTERQADVAGEGADVVETLLTQVEATLEKGGVKLPELPAGDPYSARLEQLQRGFDAALPLLAKAGTVRRSASEYFSGSGEKISGDVLYVGGVAAYGLAQGGLGALAPAGEGRLKLWPQAGGVDTARVLSEGGTPKQLGLFLYESLDKGVEQRHDKTVREVVESGGEIGWVIVVGGVLALLLVLARALILLPNSVDAGAVIERMRPHLQNKQFGAALAIAEKTRGALGRVLSATLRGIERPREQLEDTIDEAVLHETPRLDRFGNAIFVIAAVSPLLGLLGTVTGMIATFDIITEFGTGNPKLLSGGISIALVTTELGLIVAIPCLVLGNFLGGWAEQLKGDLDRASLRVVNLAHGASMIERPSAQPTGASGINDEALAPS
jgi:biopolymer transport protein ExbB